MIVARPIRYKKPGPDFRKYFEPSRDPDQPLILDFSHLSPGEIALCVRKGILREPV